MKPTGKLPQQQLAGCRSWPAAGFKRLVAAVGMLQQLLQQ
jgi:hypothetical protein